MMKRPIVILALAASAVLVSSCKFFGVNDEAALNFAWGEAVDASEQIETRILPVAPFDAVVCFETLEHVRHPRVLLAGIHDVLRDGGRLLLSVPNDRFERVDENGNNLDPFHLHVFERGEVLGLLGDTGFRVERMLGQDMCNRVVSASSSLLEAGLADEGQVRDLVRVSDPRSLVLAARLLGYPDDVAPDESYSRIYVCKRA